MRWWTIVIVYDNLFHCPSDDVVIVAYNQPFLGRHCIDSVVNSYFRTMFWGGMHKHSDTVLPPKKVKIKCVADTSLLSIYFTVLTESRNAIQITTS